MRTPMWTTFRVIDNRAGDLAAELPLLSVSQYRGVVPRSEITDNEARADDLSIYKVCQAGDVVLNRMSAYNGAVGEAKIAGLVSPDYLVMRPTEAADPTFLTYLIKTEWFIGEMSSRVRGIGSIGGGNVRTPRIGAKELGSIKVDLPDFEQQREIVTFLDRETVEIDDFIAEQEGLIALLNERRAATITQAVSHGLHMGSPMRKSGNEVVPQFPTHWVREKLSRLGLTMASGTSVNGYSDPDDLLGVRVLKTGCASKGYFDPSENKKVVEADLHRVSCPVSSGSLIVNRANTPELVGSCALVGESYKDLYLSDKLWQLDFDKAENRFMYWWMKTPSYRSQIRFYAVGASASMQNLSFADFKSFAIALPPTLEQVEIADYLDRETSEIDAAIADAKQAIELSKERRAALISAAVTGKIDVRNHITADLGAA